MSRAKRGLPLLFNHDTDQPIGRLEDVKLRKDGKLGAMMRFSKNPRAQEVRQDVIDGILTDTSIGYRINSWTESRDEKSGKSTYTADNWTPMEGSIAPVPADASVGANRSAERAAHPVIDEARNTPIPGKEAIMPEPVAVPAPAPGVVGVSREAEEKLIRGAAKVYKMEAECMDWLDRGLNIEQVREEIEKASTKRAQTATPAGEVELSPKETRQYNLSKAILSLADGNRSGLEFEVSDQIAKGLGKAARGFYMPSTLHNRAAATGQLVATSSLGGAAVQTTLQPVIEILRNRLVARKAGCRFLTGLTDTISFPRQITAGTFNWTGEDPSTANAAATITFNNLTMSPKTGMATGAFSRNVLIQSSPDMQALVLDDLMQIVGLGIDLAAFSGTGANNQPTGVRGTSAIGNRTLGSDGAALAWTDLVGLETDVAVGNADLGTLAYVTNAKARGKLKTTLKSTTAGSAFLWEGANDPGTINGYNAFASNQISSALTQGTSTTICSSIIFGNWAELLVGLWGNAFDIVVDPYSLKNQGMIEVTAFTMVDIGVRHAASFSKSDAVLTT